MKVSMLTEGSHSWSVRAFEGHWASNCECPMSTLAQPVLRVIYHIPIPAKILGVFPLSGVDPRCWVMQGTNTPG